MFRLRKWLEREQTPKNVKRLTSIEKVIDTAEEIPNNIGSELHQAAAPLGTTPTPSKPPINVGGNYYKRVSATDNSRVHLGNAYHYHGEKARLQYVEGATFDGYSQVHGACHPATRKELLQQIQDWAQRRDGKSIFWLNGMAGTGKSTISYTIATWLTQQKPFGVVDLGASFFFKRGEAGRGSAALLFPTIARQLTRTIGGLDVILARAIDADPDICSKSLGEQFNKLIREPLQQLSSAHTSPTFVIVLDALDECETRDIGTVLQLWSNVSSFTNICLRLFLASRPDLPVLSGFDDISVTVHLDVNLQDVAQETVRDDILIFLQDRFADVRNKHNRRPWSGTLLDSAWPADTVLHELAAMATPLFIIAATVLLFVSDTNFDPRERLEIVLQTRRIGQMTQIAQTYLPVLQQITASLNDKTEEEKVCSEFRIVVGAIVTVAEPLSRAALATLLRVPVGTVVLRLQPLHSVLHIPANAEAPIRPLHLSFREYLTGTELQNGPFSVDGSATHNMLWRRCLQLLSGPDGLHENMCGLSHPGQLRCEVTSAQINKYLLPAFRYACQYWVHHVQSSAFLLSDDDEIHAFLQEHFLNWLEALSLLDRLSEAIQYIQTLQSNIALENSLRISEFLEDARRFILANRFVGELVPLQLYSSAIIFAPKNSIIRNICGHPPTWIQQCPITPLGWSLELQKLEGHTHSVNAVAFSHDGLLLASASDDKTIRLWNPTTGQEVQTLEGHTSSVNAVAFSHDGSLLASASYDKTVRLWNPTTGQEMQTLEGHTKSVNAVAFSHDGSLLASASDDKTIRLWNPTTGQEVQTLEGHTDSVNAVAFSHDGSLLASASDDKTVRLWNPTTGQEMQTLEGHTKSVNAVVFSRDGSLLASASYDKTVRLWNPTKGQEVQTLEGHTHSVNAVAFSHDGSLLASASNDKTVRLWNPTTGQEVQTLEGHTDWVNAVAFSHDGLLLASASYDKTVRLWNPTTGQEVQTLEGHTDWVNAVAFSHDGSLLASASYDKTVRLWNPTTGQEVQTLEGHTDWVNAVAFSHDGSLLASASDDKTIRLWNPTTGQEVQTLEGHTHSVNAVAFSHDGLLLASASDDKTVRLWNPTTGQEVKRISSDEYVSPISFTGNNKCIVTNRGLISIDEGCLPEAATAFENALRLSYDWIEHNDDKLIWLPHEYRTVISALWGNRLAIGQQNGRIVFIQITYP